MQVPQYRQPTLPSNFNQQLFSEPRDRGLWGNMSTLDKVGVTADIAGSAISAIGSYFTVQAQREQYKSAALNAEFQESMANINARQAEKDAQAIMRAGRGQVAQLTMARGQEIARKRVSAASRGVTGASVGEVLATEELVKQIDMQTINENTVRAAGQARMQGVNHRNQSLLAGVSAGNLRRSAGTLNPALAFHNSATSSFGSFANNLARRRRR